MHIVYKLSTVNAMHFWWFCLGRQVQRGAHTCLRCGTVLPDSELQLYRSAAPVVAAVTVSLGTKHKAMGSR